jgi:hypothetical protein
MSNPITQYRDRYCGVNILCRDCGVQTWTEYQEEANSQSEWIPLCDGCLKSRYIKQFQAILTAGQVLVAAAIGDLDGHDLDSPWLNSVESLLGELRRVMGTPEIGIAMGRRVCSVCENRVPHRCEECPECGEEVPV